MFNEILPEINIFDVVPTTVPDRSSMAEMAALLNATPPSTTPQSKASDFVRGEGSALALAKQGFHIHRVHTHETATAYNLTLPKDRVKPKAPASNNGFKDATADGVAIQLAGRWQSENGVGIATGHDGLLVFDLDTDKKWQEAGRDGPTNIFQSQAGQALATLIGDRINNMRWLATPTGGAHFYVRVTGIPAGAAIKCGTDVFKTKAGDGSDGVALDLRGEGGYVVAYDGGTDGIRNKHLSVHDLPWFTWQELVDAGVYSSVAAPPVMGGQALGPTPSHAGATTGAFGSITRQITQAASERL